MRPGRDSLAISRVRARDFGILVVFNASFFPVDQLKVIRSMAVWMSCWSNSDFLSIA